MNWGEIQIESLKKMFLNSDDITADNLDTYKKDKKYRTYLSAMPQAANEAINYILENGKPLVKSYKLKYKDTNNKYNLETLIPNFKRIYQIVCEDNNVEYYVEGNNVLAINGWSENGKDIIVYYESAHELLKSSSSASTLISLSKYLTSLIPLYIAVELYKDDDMQMATMYMNEFMTNVANITGKDFNPNPKEITSVFGMEW